MQTVKNEGELRAAVAGALTALIELGRGQQYYQDWGSPVSAMDDDRNSNRTELIVTHDRFEFRLNGVQLRLYTTVKRSGAKFTFSCWVCGAGDEVHYGTFVPDANRRLQELGVLEDGR